MRAWLVAVWVFVVAAGCGKEPWMPERYPAYVVIVDELSDEQLAAVQDGGEAWNEAFGAEILHIVYAPGQHRACHQINIELGQVDDGKIGTTSWEWLSCGTVVRLSSDPGWSPRQLRWAATHELGHALGLHHVADEADIMHATFTAEGVITKPDLDSVRETVEAAGGVSDE